MSLFPSVFQEYVPPQIANHITSRLCYLMTPVVTGLVFVGLLLFASHLSTTSQGLISFAASCVWIALTSLIFRPQRASPGSIGIVVAIRCETSEERNRVTNDLIPSFRSHLREARCQQSFEVIEALPQSLPRSPSTSEEWARFLKRRNAQVVIWGTLSTRNQGDTFALRLDGAVAHQPIPANTRRVFATELREAVPQLTSISLEDELKGFETTSATLSDGTKYVVAIAAGLSGSFAVADELLTALKKTYPTSKRTTNRRGRKRKVPGWTLRLEEAHLSALTMWCRSCIQAWQEDKSDNTPLSDLQHVLQRIERSPLHTINLEHLITKAYVAVSLHRDGLTAEKLLRKCQILGFADPLWRLSLAFVRCILGKHDRVLELYQEALSLGPRVETVLEVEEYCQWWLSLYGGPAELHLLSALLNARSKLDVELALSDLRSFREKTTLASNSPLFEEAERLEQQLRASLPISSMVRSTCSPVDCKPQRSHSTPVTAPPQFGDLGRAQQI